MKSLMQVALVLVAFTTILFIDETRGQGRGPYQSLPQFDVALADAGNFNYGGRNERGGRSLDGDIVTADGKYVLFELDELEPIPCELEKTDRKGRRSTGATLVRADALVGSGSCTQVRGRGVTSLGGNGGNFGRGTRGKRAATSDTKLRWPTRTIPYQLSAPSSDPFVSDELDSINQAVADYSKYTCLNFVRRTNQADYINIIRDGGCYSSVGWIYWDQPNRLSLARGCAWNKNIPIHEFMHAIGIYHQQSRPDRDQYVRIHLENVQPGQTHNFLKLKPEEAVLGGTEYSYRSVMHYSKTGFSIDYANKNTITTIDPKYLNIIGRATTFSFEDIQLINHIYQCDRGCTNTCPGKSYRDKDCNCWCPNGDNYDVPAIICNSTGNRCNEVDVACNCASAPNTCSGLDNTQCNTNTGACECDSNSFKIDGQCRRDPICTEVGLDCQCSRRGSSACNPLQNTVCNTRTNACDCQPGYAQNGNGDCVNIDSFPCDRIDKSCFCSLKSNGCSRLANSYCNMVTNKCECDEDYFDSSGFCARTSACTTAGQACHCSVQGQDACASIPGSACDEVLEACTCLPSYQQTAQGTCEINNDNYISDGMSVSPFVTSSDTTSGSQFIPMRGEEAERTDDQFGVAPNGWHLKSSGRGSDQRGVIKIPTPVGRGTWCIQYSYKMSKAALWAETSTDGNDWVSRGVGVHQRMRRFFRKELIYSTTTQLYVRFRAEMYPGSPRNSDWSVIMDPIVVKRC